MAHCRNANAVGPTPRRRGRPTHRAAAWLGVLALLVQLFVPFLHQPAYAASPELPWDLSDFCLASGHLPPGYGPDSDERGPRDPAEQETTLCSICKTLQQTGSFVPLTAVSVLYRSDRGVRASYASRDAAIARWRTSSSQPRAPPVLV